MYDAGIVNDSFDSLVTQQLLAHRRVQLIVIDREPDHRVDDARRWASCARPAPVQWSHPGHPSQVWHNDLDINVDVARPIAQRAVVRSGTQKACSIMPRSALVIDMQPEAPRSRKGAATRARLVDSAKEEFEADRVPRNPHLRHRQARRHVARQLLPLLRFEGADLPRGRRGPGSAAHRTRRRRRHPPRTPPSSTASCAPTAATSTATAPTAKIMGVIEEVSRYDTFVNEARMQAPEALRRTRRGLGPTVAGRRSRRSRHRSGDRRSSTRVDDRPVRRAVARRGLGRLRLRSRRRTGHTTVGERDRTSDRLVVRRPDRAGRRPKKSRRKKS